MAAKYDPVCLILDWLMQHQKVMKKKELADKTSKSKHQKKIRK